MGAPKGRPRPAGAGRKKGTPNKVTSEVKELARQYGQEAVDTLAQLMRSAESEQAQIAAAKELLDRGYGKATQPLEHSGAGGEALSIKVVFGDGGSPS
jgi:hypothetical protein